MVRRRCRTGPMACSVCHDAIIDEGRGVPGMVRQRKVPQFPRFANATTHTWRHVREKG